MVRRTRIAALLTLAMINVFTLGRPRRGPHAAAPARGPEVADRRRGPVRGAGTVLAPATAVGALPTASGLRSALAGPAVRRCARPPGVGRGRRPGHRAGAAVRRRQPARRRPPRPPSWSPRSPRWPCSAPNARFTTRVVNGATPDRIILVGGGDPTLAVNQFPAQDYPRPATLASLAAATAQALKLAGRTTVSVGYDTSLYTGPLLAPGWPADYVTTGNVTPIVSLEVDQGRLTPAGIPKTPTTPTTSARAAPTRRPGGRVVRRPAGRRRHPRHRSTRGPDRPGARRGHRQRVLAAAVGHRGSDARGEQQRDRREPRAPGRPRRPASPPRSAGRPRR